MKDRLETMFERRSTGVAVFALGVLILLLFADGIASGRRTFYTPFDGVEQSYAFYQKLARALHQGYLPLWDANTLGGHLFVGEIQPGVFYPPNIIVSLLFGHTEGIGLAPLEWIVVVHYFLAAAGMYVLMRRWHLTLAGGLLASLVFASAGCVSARTPAQPQIFLGLTWIPVGMLFLTVALQRDSLIAYVGAGAVIGLQILAGHVQPSFHTAILYGIYIVWHLSSTPTPHVTRIRMTAVGISACIIAMLVIMFPQLWLSGQYLANAYRWVGAENPIGPGEKVPFDVYGFKYVVEPQEVLNLIDPYKFPIADSNNLFIGIVPLALVIIFACSPALRMSVPAYIQLRGFLLLVLTFGILTVPGHYSFMSHVLYAIPSVNQIRELGRYVILIHFALATLAGLSLDALARFNVALSAWGRTVVLAATLLLTLETLYLIFVDSAGLSLPTIIGLGTLAFVFALLGLGARGRLIAVVGVTGVALCTFVNRERLMPPIPTAQQGPVYFARNAIVDYLAPYYGRYRVILDNSANLPRNYGHAHPIQTKMGHGATMWRPYFDFIAQDWSLDGQVHDLLNIRWVVSRLPLSLTLIFEDQRTGLKLFERKNYYPRVFFKSHLGTPGRDLESRKYFDVIDYRDHYQRYRIHTSQTEDVIFSEVNYPGWRAFVNGVSTPIVTADIHGMKPLFRQISLPPGKHEVEFRYLF